MFLVLQGKVLMGVRNLPELDRVFSPGSLLGLPATYTGHPYSLTAVTVAESDIVHLRRITCAQKPLIRRRPLTCLRDLERGLIEVVMLVSGCGRSCGNNDAGARTLASTVIAVPHSRIKVHGVS